MRILFVSGTGIGGAARSTHELARVLAGRGHAVATLVRDEGAPRRTALHRRIVNARARFASTPARGAIDRLARQVGRRLRPAAAAGSYAAWTALRPENALARAVATVRPDVVVVNSIDLPAWRQLRGDLAVHGIPVALYIREETGLLHLSHSRVFPDLVLANARGHAAAAAAAELGVDAIVVPSIIDCARCRVESTRKVALFVNPVAMYGVDVALELAARRPAIPFAFVESWPLRAAELAALKRALASRPNAELRRYRDDPRSLYGDARVLLAPYRYPGRSRVIAEAQCSGIPVLGSNGYGIAEAVGAGGVLLDPDGPIDDWAGALDRAWSDADWYEELSRAAVAHSGREEMQPDVIAATLERALAGLVDAGPAAPRERR